MVKLSYRRVKSWSSPKLNSCKHILSLFSYVFLMPTGSHLSRDEGEGIHAKTQGPASACLACISLMPDSMAALVISLSSLANSVFSASPAGLQQAYRPPTFIGKTSPSLRLEMFARPNMKLGMTKHGHAWTNKALIFLSWNGLAKPEIDLLQGVGSRNWQCNNGGNAL